MAVSQGTTITRWLRSEALPTVGQPGKYRAIRFQRPCCRTVIAILVTVGYLVTCSGCALIVSGSHQTLDLSRVPAGTEVAIYRWNGELEAKAVAPAEMEVHRPRKGQPHLIVAFKEGYCPYYSVPKHTLSRGGAIWTPIYLVAVISLIGVIPFAIPMVVDNSTGASLSFPNPVEIPLKESSECSL